MGVLAFLPYLDMPPAKRNKDASLALYAHLSPRWNSFETALDIGGVL